MALAYTSCPLISSHIHSFESINSYSQFCDLKGSYCALYVKESSQLKLAVKKTSLKKYPFVLRAMAESKEAVGAQAETKLGIRIERNPSEERLTELGVRSWSKWGCPPSDFPWTYSDRETCYLLKGKVKVTPDGTDDYVEFGKGDLVQFPAGMGCTWSVSETVDKHYLFD